MNLCLKLSLLILCLSCGPAVSSKKNNSSVSHENLDAYKVVSNEGKEFAIVFYDDERQLLSSREYDYPEGAFEAMILFSGENFFIEKVEYTTCCHKTFEVDVNLIDEGLIKIDHFILANAKHKLTVYFSDGDLAVFE